MYQFNCPCAWMFQNILSVYQSNHHWHDFHTLLQLIPGPQSAKNTSILCKIHPGSCPAMAAVEPCWFYGDITNIAMTWRGLRIKYMIMRISVRLNTHTNDDWLMIESRVEKTAWWWSMNCYRDWMDMTEDVEHCSNPFGKMWRFPFMGYPKMDGLIHWKSH